jgi:hypothetical protein
LSVWYWGRADLSTYISLPVLFELLAFNSVSLTIKEELRLEVFLVKRQKLASTKVCDVEVELELLAESSFFEQEMRVRLKKDMKIM